MSGKVKYFNHSDSLYDLLLQQKSNRKKKQKSPNSLPNWSNGLNCDNGIAGCGSQTIFNHCMMHLEPRLHEYVKKRDLLKKHNIQPTVPLKKEFRISSADLKKINEYDKCNKEQSKMDSGMLDGFDHPSLTACYDNSSYGQNLAYTNMSDPKSRQYRNFNKFGRDVMNPAKCSKDWKNTPCHKPLKVIDRRFFPNCGKSCANGCTCDRLCDPSWDKQLGYLGAEVNTIEGFDNGDFEDGIEMLNRNRSKTKKTSLNKDMKSRGLQYSQKSLLGNSTLKDVDYDSLLRSNGIVTRAGQSCASVMDATLKVNIPNSRARCTKDENLNHSYYKAVPYMGQGSGRGDIDLDSVVKFGESQRGSKQKKVGGITIDRFEQLPWDLQCVDHVVLPFPRGGYDTRHIDKYSRRNAHYVV